MQFGSARSNSYGALKARKEGSQGEAKRNPWEIEVFLRSSSGAEEWRLRTENSAALSGLRIVGLLVQGFRLAPPRGTHNRASGAGDDK
jgi:hypothetical protein